MVLASDVEEGISATDPLLGSKGRTESEVSKTARLRALRNGTLLRVLLFFFIYQAIATFRKTLQVPFLRTFIVCDPLFENGAFKYQWH